MPVNGLRNHPRQPIGADAAARPSTGGLLGSGRRQCGAQRCAAAPDPAHALGEHFQEGCLPAGRIWKHFLRVVEGGCCWAPQPPPRLRLAATAPMLQNLETADAAVPAALSGLSNLQCCYLDLLVSEEGGVAPPLPAGPWLASLRWLHYNVDGLARSTTSLRAASALDFLEGGALDNSQKVVWSCPAAAAFFDWLAQHPPLRRVYFDAAEGGAFDSGVFATHVMRLGRRRPSLVLEGDAEPDMRDLIDEK